MRNRNIEIDRLKRENIKLKKINVSMKKDFNGLLYMYRELIDNNELLINGDLKGLIKVMMQRNPEIELEKIFNEIQEEI